MGYFTRICVDVDLSADRMEEILIEREQVGSKEIYLFKQQCSWVADVATNFNQVDVNRAVVEENSVVAANNENRVVGATVEGNLAAVDDIVENAHNVDCDVVEENSFAAVNNEASGMNKKRIAEDTAVPMLSREDHAALVDVAAGKNYVATENNEDRLVEVTTIPMAARQHHAPLVKEQQTKEVAEGLTSRSSC
ncbi:hypothetical protein AMTR_s00063p00124150 [Amborella trichopoda]|uniref:Uncharacterized protein n=1 Tax=Amborella trichopoda TaxID=13333 RepID=U5D1D2_AMBTC|nr:hypothetical protein AMTR_s00063p00124150 [Amborella trichopoda]